MQWPSSTLNVWLKRKNGKRMKDIYIRERTTQLRHYHQIHMKPSRINMYCRAQNQAYKITLQIDKTIYRTNYDVNNPMLQVL